MVTHGKLFFLFLLSHSKECPNCRAKALLKSAVPVKVSESSTPQHQYAHSPYCSLYISKGADKEKLFNNQGLPLPLIISCILKTLMCDSGVILQEEIRC